MNTTIKLHDDADELGLSCATVEVSIDFTVHAGDPGCRHTPNGDGWPPEPPEVDIASWFVVGVTSGDGTKVDCHADLLATLFVWVSDQMDSSRESIESELLAFAEDIR